MAKAPFFPFYPADWLASPDTAQMTLEEQGAYLNLLCHQWGSPDCSLPADNAVLGYLSRAGDRWAEIGPKILRLCFERRGKSVFNRRLRRERQKYDSRVDSGREGGLKSAESRRKVSEAKSKVPSISLEAKSNQSETETEVRNREQQTTGIVEFYNRLTGRRLVDATQRKFIAPRLEEGVTSQTLRLAVVGACLKPFHLGHNDRSAIYLDPETIFRPARLDGHAEHARHATYRVPDADQVWQFWTERLGESRLEVMRRFFMARDEVLREEGKAPLGPPAVYGPEYKPEDGWPESA